MRAWASDAQRLTPRDWASIAGLALAIAVLVMALISIWIAATHPADVGCHNAPMKIIRDPQLAGIGICLAGLVVGRLSTRRVVVSRNDLDDRLAPGDDLRAQARNALLSRVASTGALLFIAFLVTYEAVTLYADVWPITYYMRCAAETATWQTYATAFFLCLLVGRWLWLPATPR